MASTLEKLIKEQVEADNLPMVEALLNSIVPLLPEGESQKLGASLMYEVLLARKPSMVNTLAHHFPITDAMAAGYLLDRSLMVHKDREAMPIALAELQQSFGNVLISAIYRGDLEMVRTLQEQCPNRPIELNYHPENGRLQADGQEVTHEFEAMQNFAGVPVFRELLEILLKYVDANDMDQEQFLYDFCDSITLDDANDLTEIVPFTGQLPSIAAGQVEHPELMLAFLEVQEAVLLKSMHGRVFCWVREEVSREMPGAVAYSPVKRAACHDVPFDFSILSTPAAFTEPVQFTEDRNAFPIMDQWPQIYLGLEVMRDESNKLLIYDDKIRQRMLQDRISLGLDQPAGYTLMSMDVELLKSFDIGKVEPQAMALAREYAQNFYSSDLLSSRFHVDRNHTSRFKEGVKDVSLPTLFEFAANSQDKDAIFNSFEQSFWKNVFYGFSAGLEASGILEARNRFGWTNVDGRKGFSLNPEKIHKLFDAGYAFAGNVVGVNTSYGVSTPSECALLNHKVIAMGGWPSADPRPKDVEDALKIGIRQKNLTLYAIYIHVHGAEAAIQACKTKPQYEYILKIFTQEEIRPFAHKLPLKQLGDVFSRDMGL